MRARSFLRTCCVCALGQILNYTPNEIGYKRKYFRPTQIFVCKREPSYAYDTHETFKRSNTRSQKLDVNMYVRINVDTNMCV